MFACMEGITGRNELEDKMKKHKKIISRMHRRPSMEDQAIGFIKV